jgi:hypothetical protein
LQSAGDHILSNDSQALELMDIVEDKQALSAPSGADQHEVYEAAFDIDKEDSDQQTQTTTSAPAILSGPNQWELDDHK